MSHNAAGGHEHMTTRSVDQRNIAVKAWLLVLAIATTLGGEAPTSGAQVPPPPIVLGALKDDLTTKDVDQISKLAISGNHTLWLIETYRSQDVPETWYVNANLTPFEVTMEAKRGQVVQVEGTVKGGRAERWRVIDSGRHWIQVPLPRRPFNESPSLTSLDGVVQVIGRFTTAELLGIVRLMRSGPEVTRSGTVSHPLAQPVPARLDGQLPVLTIDRLPTGHIVVYSGRLETEHKAVVEMLGSRWVLSGFLP